MYTITPPPLQQQAQPQVGGYTIIPQQQDTTRRNSGAVNFLRQLLGQGAAFGFGDEIEAGVKSALSFAQRDGYRYSDELTRIRENNRTFQRENPVTSMAAQIAGGVAIPGAGLARVANVAARPIVGTAALGTGFGSVGAFAAGEGGLANRLEAVPAGAIAGGLGGVALGIVANAVGRGTTSVARALDDYRDPTGTMAASRKTIAEMDRAGIDLDQLRTQVQPPAPTGRNARVTADQITEMVRLRNQGMSIDAIAEQFGLNGSTVGRYIRAWREQTAVPRNLADITSDMTEGGAKGVSELLQAAANVPGRGQNIAFRRLNTRQAAQRDRLRSHIRAAFGNLDYQTAVLQVQERLRTQGSQQFQAATARGAQPINLSRWAQAMRQRTRDLPDDMAQPINRVLNNFEKRSGTIGGMATFRGLTSPRAVHQAKMALDDAMETAWNAGRRTLYRELAQAKTQLFDELEQQAPDLVQAIRYWRSEMQILDALRSGRQFNFRSGEDLDEMIRMFEGLPDELQGYARAGFARMLNDKLDNAQEMADVTRFLRTDGARDILRRILPAEQAERFLRRVAQEATTTQTRGATLTGSRTTPLAERINEMRDSAEIASGVMTANPGRVWSRVTDQIMRQLTERNSEQIVDFLTRTDPAELVAIVDRLRQLQPMMQRGENWRGIFGQAGAASGGAFAGRRQGEPYR